MSPKVSVIIPVKNDEKRIEACLNAVINQTIQPFEIIIIDGNSTDDTVKNAMNFPVTVFFENFGTVGGARQVGVEKSNGDYVAFTDSDCIPDIKWLENLLKEFQTEIVGVGGGIKNIGKGLWEESISFALDSFLGSANSVQDRVLKTKRFVKSISGCNSMYRKKDVLKIGGFNASYSMNEDTDLNKRLEQYGKILYTPDAVVLHNQGRNVVGFIKRMYAFGFGRGFNRLVDLQIIPPLSLIIVIATLFINPIIFFTLIVLYLIIVLIFSLDIALRKTKKIKYFITVPIIFLLEHSFYSLGFWWGILRRGIGDKK